MSVKIDKGRLASGLELTPMIDIVFLLMIFFLVASKLDEDDRSLDVVLPQAAAAKPPCRAVKSALPVATARCPRHPPVKIPPSPFRQPPCPSAQLTSVEAEPGAFPKTWC